MYVCNNFHGPQGHSAECKKPILKGHTLYYSIYVTFSKRHTSADGEQISGCQGLGWSERP